MKTSQKISVGLLSLSTLFGMFAPFTVQAKSTTTATSSGSTTGNQSNTITSSNCTGSQQVSGTDAQVFSKITPDHAGTIVCSKSNGFKTTVSGTGNVKSYHWTAWYKNTLEEEVDTTLGTGNYHGFSKAKVEKWKAYADEIKKLNGGRFPESRDYTYPTDTTDGKLSFWGDIAGYYGILGDPQYSNIHLEAYQQFSYRVENVYAITSIRHDPNYCNDYPDECKSQDTGKNPVINGGSNNGGNSSGKPNGTSPGTETEDSDKNGPSYCMNGIPSNSCIVYCTSVQQGCEPTPLAPDTSSGPNTPSTSSGSTTNKGESSSKPCFGSGCYYDTKSSSVTYYLGKGNYKTITTYVETNYETKLVKVADANVAANAYATEIAAYGRLALQQGSRGTVSYDVGLNKFWKTKPSYWVDGGKVNINNNSAYPYSFVSENANGSGVNNINLYATLSKRDKFYNVIHGYQDVTDADKSYKYPDQDVTCVEVKGKEVCSVKETPVIEIQFDINDDEPQTQVEIDRFVHLTKDKK